MEGRILRRIFALLTCLAMLLGCIGCVEQPSQQPELVVTEGVPSYADDQQFSIGAYCSPAKANYEYWDSVLGKLDENKVGFASNVTEQEFLDYKAAGLNFMLTEYNGDYDTAAKFKDSDLYPFMELAEKVGLDVYVHTGTLTGLTSTGDPRISDESKEYMQRLVNDLSGYTSFKGFSLRDEPTVAEVASFKAVREYLTGLKSDVDFFTCMRPMSGTLTVGGTNDDYGTYVDTYLDLTGEFIYDFYPLWNNPVTGQNYIDTKWYVNMETVASKAKNYEGAKTGITVQSGSWGKPGMQGMESGKRTIKSKADIGFQVYSALAYGYKTIGYFTYWLHWAGASHEVFYDAMVMPPKQSGEAGVKTDAYYAVQALNNEITKFDHVLMNYNWQGTTAFAPEGKQQSQLLSTVGKYNAERIESVSTTEEIIIGHLKDADGYDGFMLVNSTEPSEGKTAEVTVTFRKASKALCYIHGEEQTVDLTDGSYTFSVGAGEGVFVIPIV